jgi:hypothetical protein
MGTIAKEGNTLTVLVVKVSEVGKDASYGEKGGGGETGLGEKATKKSTKWARRSGRP